MAQEKNAPSTLEQLIRFLPLYTATLIFLSFYKQHCFYREFKLNIYEYLSMPELLLSFLPDIQLFIVSVLGYSILFVTMSQFMSYPDEEEQGTYQIKTFRYYLGFLLPKKLKRIGFKRLSLLLKRLLEASWPVLGLILTVLLANHAEERGWLDDCGETLFEDTSFSLLFFMLLFFMFWLGKTLSEQISSLVALLVFIYLALWSFKRVSWCDAQALKEGKARFQLEFDANSSHFQTSTDTVYVGSTRDYLFLYQRSNQTTHVFSKSGLSNLKIK